MLTTDEAINEILAAMPTFPSATVKLSEAIGRVLRQSVVAERDQPPFDRVTMDGIALNFASFAAGRRAFPLAGRQHAGETRLALDDAGACIEIMTGAALPVGADTVVPVERIAIANDVATLESGYAPTEAQFVHTQGSDYPANSEVLQPGMRIEAADVAILASCGLADVEVAASPTISVISTGDELVPAGQPILDHQVRMSNGPAVVALLARHGYLDCAHDHLVDDRDELATKLAAHLDAANVLILSGGVSMGKADFVPEVLVSLGVEVVFHKISQRPGLPMWFGIGKEGQAVFALPGNPVSTLVCCRQYVLPALGQASGLVPAVAEWAALKASYEFRPSLTCFLPVRIENDAGRLLATPAPTNTSGDFAALSGTNGYVELPAAESQFPAGSQWRLHRWNTL